MIPAALLAMLFVQTPLAPLPPVATTPAMPPPVTEWAALPFYPLPRTASLNDGVGFVRDEVEAGRCRPQPAPTARLQLPVAILVGEGGLVRQIVPRAIGCSSVEQYVVGYLLSLTRMGTDASTLTYPGWYQLTVDYRW